MWELGHKGKLIYVTHLASLGAILGILIFWLKIPLNLTSICFSLILSLSHSFSFGGCDWWWVMTVLSVLRCWWSSPSYSSGCAPPPWLVPRGTSSPLLFIFIPHINSSSCCHVLLFTCQSQFLVCRNYDLEWAGHSVGLLVGFVC
jgi:hypothetical protein